MKSNTRDLIKKYNLRLVKSLGQNFLNDYGVVMDIAESAGVGPEDLVLEVGPGIGSMTVELAKEAGKVLAVEIDKNLIGPLKANLSEFSNVEVINKDILKVNIKELISEHLEKGIEGSGGNEVKPFRSVKVVANLPYYITTPIIMKFLEENPGIDTMVFMVQKEVAQRMAANPGRKDYGALSVAVQFYSKPEIVFNVPPHCFIPQPEVDSSVVRLQIYKEPPVDLLDKDAFFKTVKAAFGQRRKTLVNALSNSGFARVSKEEIKEILINLGIGEKQRGETLSISQFAELSNILFQKK